MPLAPLLRLTEARSPGPEVIKHFSCSTQLSMKFFLLINIKMPTIVGILTFMSGKNSILGFSEPIQSWIYWYMYFYTYEHLKFHAKLSWARKKFYNLGAWSKVSTSCCWLFCCLTALWYNISVPGREKRERNDKREKNVQTNPARTYCKRSRPLPYYYPNK